MRPYMSIALRLRAMRLPLMPVLIETCAPIAFGTDNAANDCLLSVEAEFSPGRSAVAGEVLPVALGAPFSNCAAL
jgi:hypothetical protein